MSIKSFFKYLISIYLLFSIASCGLILNDRSPGTSISNAKLSSAIDVGLVEGTNTYMIWDAVSLLLFGAGFVGFIVDYATNSNYVVVDKPAFKVWSKEYDNNKKEELKKWSKN